MATALDKSHQEDHENLQGNYKIVKVSQLLKLPSITAPAAPEAGDLWNESGVLKFYDGSETQTIAFETEA
jgi:hypothetical protein